MADKASTEENPFKKIEITIIVIFVIWVVGIAGWFYNNSRVTPHAKLVSNVEIFLEKNAEKSEKMNCVVDKDGEAGACSVLTTEQKELVVQCPVTSSMFEFAKVFFVQGQPCEFLTAE